MALTIKTIAKMANVSCTTVSRVLNNKADVNEETRARILELIEKYQFQPNVFARGIQSNKSNCIGLIIPRELDYIMTNSFYAEIIRGIVHELNGRGYYLLFCNTAKHDDIMNIYRQRRVDGFIMIRLGACDKDIINVLKSIEAPFAATTTVQGEDAMLHVDIDNYRSACMAVEHLISLGHRRIGMIAASNSLINSRQRLAAFRDTMNKHQLPYDDRFVTEDDTSMRGGYEAMKRMLRLDDGPTAMFVAGDIMALGALRAIKEAGKCVPEDISVIGFDGIPESEYTDPPLTTIRQPIFEKGQKAAAMLIDLLEGQTDIQPVRMEAQLIVRASTAKPL
jgi:DNA-binding LacI/PurR family transcriptional regulator